MATRSHACLHPGFRALFFMASRRAEGKSTVWHIWHIRYVVLQGMSATCLFLGPNPKEQTPGTKKQYSPPTLAHSAGPFNVHSQRPRNKRRRVLGFTWRKHFPSTSSRLFKTPEICLAVGHPHRQTNTRRPTNQAKIEDLAIQCRVFSSGFGGP